jgi:capping protein alpha
MSSTVDITSSWVQGAPPSELADVVKDIKALTSDDDPGLIAKLKPAFQKYNEEQLTAVKLPGGNDYVCSPPPPPPPPSRLLALFCSTP